MRMLRIIVAGLLVAGHAYAEPTATGQTDWSQPPDRRFVAGMLDTGFLYVRPRFSLGYGRPYHAWVGIDANPLFNSEGFGTYVGVRGALPWIDLRIGARYFHAYFRSFLEPQAHYERDDIENSAGPSARYLSYEAELSTHAPLGPGEVLGEAAVSAVTGADAGLYVYEETMRAVVKPPWVWRTRLGYLWPLNWAGAFRVGAAAEVVGIPGRDLRIWRAGGLARVRLYADLEARGTFISALSGPDHLGLVGGDSFLMSLRYRWALGGSPASVPTARSSRLGQDGGSPTLGRL